MKSIAMLVFVLSLGSLLAVHALPAKKASSLEEDVEIIPLEAQFGGRQPIVDTGLIGGSFGGSPFDGLLNSFSGIMNRMRQEMDSLFKHLPGTGQGLPVFPGMNIDLGKGNTTSVTKVIDGHKVVINETEYKQEGEMGGTFFKVRVIDVLPDSSELSTDKNAESVPEEGKTENEAVNLSKEPEFVEDSNENEIPKNSESEDFSNLETFDEVDTGSSPFAQSQSTNKEKVTDGLVKVELDNSAEKDLDSIEGNSIVDAPKFIPIDMSRDTYINKLMSDKGASMNPDAEIFSELKDISEPLAQVKLSTVKK